MKKIYELNLHEGITITDPETKRQIFYVTRVPGGWLYYDSDTNSNVFVPYNNEFA